MGVAAGTLERAGMLPITYLSTPSQQQQCLASLAWLMDDLIQQI